jgi:ribonuclease P protein component
MGVAPPCRLRLGRDLRLKHSRDFARLRREGQRLATGCLAANWQRLPADARPRLGVIVSSRIGESVARSRVRRLLREAFRLHQYDLVQPVELILVARQSIAGREFAAVERDFLLVMRRAGLLKPASPTSAG